MKSVEMFCSVTTKGQLRSAIFLLAVLLLVCFDAGECKAVDYTVKDLGKLDIPPSSGSGINAAGHVTGYAYVTGEMYGHAFLYDSSMHDLGTFGGHDSSGIGINDHDQVTGGSQPTTVGVVRAFLYDGSMHDLGTLGGPSSVGYGINAGGQIAGYADTVTSGTHAFLWTPDALNGASGTMHDLGTLVGPLGGTSIAYGINASGQVTGYSQTSDGTSHAFLWVPTVVNGSSGAMHDLGTLGGLSSNGYAVNANGLVAGYSFTDEGDSIYHAFLWTPAMPNGPSGSMIDLGTLSGTQSTANGINNLGEVVGFAGLAGDLTAHAFLYTEKSGMVDLNTLIDPQSGWDLQNASGINDAGQITGFGEIGGESHAFLLTPVPEPNGLALGTVAGLLVFVGSVIRRRNF